MNLFFLDDGREELYQWDLDRRLQILDDRIKQVHYHLSLKEEPLVCEVYEQAGIRYANIPNILLQKAQNFRAYAYCDEYTLGFEQLTVTPRSKPSDYVYTETEILTWSELSEEVKRLSQQVGEPIVERGEGNNSAQLRNVMAKAVSPNSIVFGWKSQAGCKGFRITNMSSAEEGLSDNYNVILDGGWYIVSYNANFNVDDLINTEYSVRIKSMADRVGKITKVEKISQFSAKIYVAPYFHPNKWSQLTSEEKQEAYEDSYIISYQWPAEVGEVIVGNGAYAEGQNTKALQGVAHAEGAGTLALGFASHAEGNGTTAFYAAHAEGDGTKAINYYAHSEGYRTTASGEASHAEAYGTKAQGKYSHTEGMNTITSEKATAAHAEGSNTQALAHYSHTSGVGTIAKVEGQFVTGKYNADNKDAVFITGNGTSDTERSNAFEVLQDGRAKVYGKAVEDDDVITQKYLGVGNKIGSKAFRILKASSTTTEGGWTADYFELDDVTGLEPGMLACFRLSGKEYHELYELRSISGNRVFINGTINFSSYTPIVEGDYLKIAEHSELGTFDLNYAAIATGGGNIAGNSYTDAGGKNNIVDGKYGFARGSTNRVGYLGAAFGADNKILGEATLGTGAHNTVGRSGTQGFIYGQKNYLKHERSIVGGYQNNTSNSDQAVFGRISRPISDSLLTIGNGKENSDGTFTRKNAFVVHEDGRISAGKEAIHGSDIPTYGQVQVMLADFEQKLPTSTLNVDGRFTYYPENVNLLEFVASEDVRYGESSIEADTRKGVTGLPDGVAVLRCIVFKTLTGIHWIQGFQSDGAIFSIVYDTASWSPWRRLDISEELQGLESVLNKINNGGIA